MDAQPLSAQIQQEPNAKHWSLTSRVAFRFCFAYFGLFCLATQIFGTLFPIPKVDVPDPGTLWPLRQITFWAAAHIFHIKLPLVYADSGSGDKTFDWVLAFCLLVFAALATVIWSVLDRRRENYVTLHKWFRLFIRFALASQLIVYGWDKVIPLQMPFPYLARFAASHSETSLRWEFSGLRLVPRRRMRSLPGAPKCWVGSCSFFPGQRCWERLWPWQT